MKIAIIGYGKMGHEIESIAISRGHEIVARIDAGNTQDLESPDFVSADVAIEFSTPATAAGNYLKAFAAGVPVVSGTTGWTARMPEIKNACHDCNATFLWSSNFSIGVNIFFAVNRYLAAIMDHEAQYTPSITEIHHIHKLDHPSGTAITLADGIIDLHHAITGWSEESSGSGTLRINHKREGEVPGTHIITWDSEADAITLEHRAKSRRGFALGAVMAAEWIKNRKGWLTMDMMMNDILSPRI